jgi:hypothetical protein
MYIHTYRGTNHWNKLGTLWNTFHFQVYNPRMQCRACKHPDRVAIDQQIVAGSPLRSIAAATGLSLGGLVRHKQCIKTALAQAIEAGRAERASQGSDLLDRVQRLADEAIGILETAKASKDLKAGTAAICAAVRCLELCGRLDGSLASPTSPGLHLTLNRVTNNTIINYNDDVDFARMISEATRGFDPNEISRLQQLAGCTEPAPPIVMR